MLSSKKIIFFIVAILYISYTIFPLLSDLINIPVWLPSIAAFGLMFLLYPKAFFNRTFYWFIVYAIILLINVLLNRPLTIGIGTVEDSKKILIEYAWIIPSISIFCILQYQQDDQLDNLFQKWSIALLFLSFLTALPIMEQYSSIRQALIDETYYEAEKIVGLPTYSLMHAWTLMVPVLCYAVKVCAEKRKFISLLALALLCFMVYDTFITTCLFLSVMSIVFTLFYYKDNKDTSILIFIVVFFFIMLLYWTGAFVVILEKIMPLFDGTYVYYKLNDMRDSLLQGELTGSSLTTRRDRHMTSWNSFFANPIFGGGEEGRHSSLIDRLGGMGLVAFIPFVMIFITAIKQVSKRLLDRTTRIFYYLVCIVALLFLYTKGNWCSENWLLFMVLAPLSLRMIEKRNLFEPQKQDSE